MYVESVGIQMGAVVNAGVARTAQASVEDNAVGAESTDGEKQQNKKDSVTISGKNGDKRVNDEKQTTENDKIRKTIESLKAQLPNSEVKFGIHDKTDRVTIKIVDKETKELIKEFPPEKTLDMIAKCMELAGVLVDEKL